jgi:protein subunit release factor B
MARRLLFSVTIHDCRVDTFTCGGHGGSGKDTSNNGVRVVHEPSGAVGECREERHQHVNKLRAFRRMTETREFKTWHRRMTLAMLGEKSIDQLVDEALDPANLRVETRDADGRWVPADNG